MAQRRDAVQQRDVAVSRELAAESTKATRRRSGARPSGWRSGRTTRRRRPRPARRCARRRSAFRQLGVMRADSLDANTAAYSPDGRRIVTGGTDGARARVGRGDAARGRPPGRAARRRPRRPLRAGGRRRSCSASRTARSVVTDASLGRAATCCSSEQGQAVQSVAVSADGRRVAAALDDGTVRVLATDGSEAAASPRRPRGRGPRRRHQRGRRPRRECRRGRQLPALGRVRRRSEDRSCTSGGDAGDGRRVQPGRQPDPRRRRRRPDPALGHARRERAEARSTVQGRQLQAAAFSRDGRRFATGGRDGVTRVWSADGGPPLARAARSALARVRRRLRAGERSRRERRRRRHRPDLGRRDGRRPGRCRAVTYNLDFNRDGRLIASSSKDGTVRVRDTSDRHAAHAARRAARLHGRQVLAGFGHARDPERQGVARPRLAAVRRLRRDASSSARRAAGCTRRGSTRAASASCTSTPRAASRCATWTRGGTPRSVAPRTRLTGR